MIFAFAPSKVMARRVYRSRSCSQDVENEWPKASSDRRGAAGGLRGWDDDSDDGKFQLKAGALDANGAWWIREEVMDVFEVPKNLVPATGWKQATGILPVLRIGGARVTILVHGMILLGGA